MGAKVVYSPKTTEGAAVRGKNKKCQSTGVLKGEYRVRMRKGREQTLMLTRPGATGEEDKPKHSDINFRNPVQTFIKSLSTCGFLLWAGCIVVS